MRFTCGTPFAAPRLARSVEISRFDAGRGPLAQVAGTRTDPACSLSPDHATVLLVLLDAQHRDPGPSCMFGELVEVGLGCVGA